eukprot:15352091-Ditylum_brightwellii.AAC.3
MEVLLMANNKAMHSPETLELLLDLDVWFANTGARCDSTDGSKKIATMIAELEMLVCNRTGNGLFKL